MSSDRQQEHEQAGTGGDEIPGDEYLSDEPGDELDEFLDSDDRSRKFLTTYVLECFGRERRGAAVNRHINEWLVTHSLEMFPSIADADYYGEVLVRKLSDESDAADEGDKEQRTQRAEASLPGDDGWVLSSLKDDAEELDFLQHGATVEDAVTLMKEKNRTKLPLFFSENDRSTLIGTVTLSSLTFEQTDATSKLVEKATVRVPVVGTDEKLFDWIPSILSHGFIYGKNQSGEIVQIYTIYDVATHLNTIAAMFLRANEIEELLRQILSRVPDPELKRARSNAKNLKSIPLDQEGKKFLADSDLSSSGEPDVVQRLVDSMMFADYMKCIGDREIWEKFFTSPQLMGASKESCIRSLNDARLARNSVMHFKRENSIEKLIPSFEALAVWLRKVAKHASAS
ncbi:hypothetical protein KACC15558_25760 [Brevibacterium ammoniilyticum]|uniref:CBS domain-containing protein n=1 Tax=Brevibacterium ammoniilyticum TaxID=1046555 RepID=A0ABP9U1N3_9MICO